MSRLLDKKVNGKFPFEYVRSEQSTPERLLAKFRALMPRKDQPQAVVRPIKGRNPR